MEESLASRIASAVPGGVSSAAGFLVDLSTPGWLWFFRILLAAGFLVAIASGLFRRRGGE